MDSTETVPPVEPGGYMTNMYGHLIPTRLVKPAIKLEDQLVKDLLARAERLREHAAAEKAAMMGDVRALLALIDEKYGVKRQGGRGGVVLSSYDGMMRVTLSVSDSITLGPELRAARALIDECIGRWSAGANANLKAIIDDAFRVGDTGRLAVDRVLGLRRIEIDDETWRNAMEAISDAIRIERSREYLRLYQRQSREARYEQVALDWSKL